MINIEEIDTQIGILQDSITVLNTLLDECYRTRSQLEGDLAVAKSKLAKLCQAKELIVGVQNDSGNQRTR